MCNVKLKITQINFLIIIKISMKFDGFRKIRQIRQEKYKNKAGNLIWKNLYCINRNKINDQLCPRSSMLQVSNYASTLKENKRHVSSFFEKVLTVMWLNYMSVLAAEIWVHNRLPDGKTIYTSIGLHHVISWCFRRRKV